MKALTTLVLVLAVTGAIFMVLRALILWYWRIDRVVELLESIDRRLKAQDKAAEKPEPVK